MKKTTYAAFLFVMLLSVLAAFHASAEVAAAPKLAPDAMLKAVAGVVQRQLPGNADAFKFEVIPQEKGLDAFEIETVSGKPVIRGSSPTAILAGLNWYLKYYCNVSFTWTGDQLNLPSPLPAVSPKVRIVTPYIYRYMYNYCTFNYTMSFWDWPEWERELDLMALNGVNLMLSIVGQEGVWQNYMKRMGFTDKEISDFIPGPGYSAWWLMENLEGWGGPVDQHWIDKRVELQHKILARMRELGMEPVFQGFYGMVPRAMIARYPKARVLETGIWGNYKRPAMLDPLDPFFGEAAAAWYDEQRKLFGETRFFGGDPFHEGGAADVDLTKSATGIQNTMMANVPGSIWVLQGWQVNPKDQLLAGIKKDNALILDLFAEAWPQWSKRDGFRGFPWVWCALANFGGNIGVNDPMGNVANGPTSALKSPIRGNLQGVGAIMEATGTNVAFWDLVFEMAWRTDAPDLEKWVSQYAMRRYGKTTDNVIAAWQGLRKTAYSADKTSTPKSPFTTKPAVAKDGYSAWGSMHREYDMCEFNKAWDLLMKDAEHFRGSDTFGHDAVDVTRQAIANYATHYIDEMGAAYANGDKAAFDAAGAKFLELLLDQDNLLSTDKHFMVGEWIRGARDIGDNDAEKNLNEWNARTLLTVWGPRDSAMGGLDDYANREWSGMLKDYYYMRWKLFIDEMSKKIDPNIKKQKINGKQYFTMSMKSANGSGWEDPTTIDWFAVEEPWTLARNPYPSAPTGDPISAALGMYKKYYPATLDWCASQAESK